MSWKVVEIAVVHFAVVSSEDALLDLCLLFSHCFFQLVIGLNKQWRSYFFRCCGFLSATSLSHYISYTRRSFERLHLVMAGFRVTGALPRKALFRRVRRFLIYVTNLLSTAMHSQTNSLPSGQYSNRLTFQSTASSALLQSCT